MAKKKKLDGGLVEGHIDTNGMDEKIVAAATAHGEESEPDMEVGDLQGVFYAAWALLTIEQRRALIANDNVKEVLSWLTS